MIDLQAHTTSYLKQLRETIITQFQKLEKSRVFQRTPWEYHSGGLCEMAIIRGEVFEKGAVHFSAIQGEQFPLGEEATGPFFATGISLITHMYNPHAPTVHMNLRYIETAKKYWFGGGYDLTPMGFFYQKDAEHFHNVAKKTLGKTLYETFSKAAEEYFYIPHRKKPRGSGGIFFDHYKTESKEKDFSLWKSIGDTFLEAILPIYYERINTPFTEKQKELQLKMRGHYVEFNLLYDRGTKFGLQSGGNIDAIFSSLPPLVKW